VPTKKVKQPLSVTHPELAKEADGWDPNSVTAGMHLPRQWKCSKGHIWEARVYQRTKSGCPYCSGRFAIKGENDLKTLDPKLAREIVDYDATTLKITSHIKVKWKCKYDHFWTARVSDRSKG
jgi:hypothetical protein